MTRMTYLKRTLATVLATALATNMAWAGFTAQTGADLVVNSDSPPAGGGIGDSFSIGGSVDTPDGQPGGTFLAFVGDTPPDPQIAGGDLNFYRYNLMGTINSVVGSLASYTGTYSIFYDQNLDGEPNEGLIVSSGTLTATALFDPVFGETAVFNGTLTQTAGPSNPAFADLSYGGSPVLLTGLYTDNGLLDGPSPTGTLTATLRQNAMVPEPASLVLVGLSALGLVVRRW